MEKEKNEIKLPTSDLGRALMWLRLSGEIRTPDSVKEELCLRTSASTLGRKFREAAAKGELLKSYYFTNKGRKVAQYSWNQEAKK